uniref:Uncharacterized protein n=1 Tax=Candidatus Kentrum sp. TUN TaxID=2126343 RepID=A0A450ZMX9_9GAMM|nr:MAG: hypothetical protein BECKTUN1418D_GA0071000_10282 [Candidatus Kentron sp. TUN]VFK56742.1 MAG: hypothetical protein BECKTUN1418F_GA0071002_109417 [Candidatus Kentron sp. TUN]VFK65645.1 MAG: hypothetical protein BECKTUN1418E_GA0071001_11111 [Candidatus Kentron sp. TUN]
MYEHGDLFAAHQFRMNVKSTPSYRVLNDNISHSSACEHIFINSVRKHSNARS